MTNQRNRFIKMDINVDGNIIPIKKAFSDNEMNHFTQGDLTHLKEILCALVDGAILALNNPNGTLKFKQE